MYPLIIVGCVHVGEQPRRITKPRELGLSELGNVQDRREVGDLQAPGIDCLANAVPDGPAVTGDEGFDPVRRANPGGFSGLRHRTQPLEQTGFEKRQVAGDDHHAIACGDFQRGLQSADRAEARQEVGVRRHTEVVDAVRMFAYHNDLVGDTLQQVDLSHDDGTAIDDEPALVSSTETAGLASGDNGAGPPGGGHRLIMTDVRTGQLVASSVYDAIQAELPQRLDFYGHWLQRDRLPDRRGNLAQMTAVLGFLRTEGEAYDRVVARAGQVAAGWTVDGLTPFRRHMTAKLPPALRARAVLALAADLVRTVHAPSRMSRRVRRRQAEVGVTASLFCAVRDVPRAPLCGFYLAATLELLARFEVPAQGRLVSCRAIEGSRCVMLLDWSGSQVAPDPAVAA